MTVNVIKIMRFDLRELLLWQRKSYDLYECNECIEQIQLLEEDLCTRDFGRIF